VGRDVVGFRLYFHSLGPIAQLVRMVPRLEKRQQSIRIRVIPLCALETAREICTAW
jgi:hypothetical protein